MFIWPTPKPALLTAVTILSQAFGDYAFVSAKLPARNRPDRFVRVSRVGGQLDNIATDAARVLVECFARDVAEVEAMCNTARTALRNAGGTTVTTTAGDVFVRCWDENSGPADFPHPDLIEWDRWQFAGELLVKAN